MAPTTAQQYRKQVVLNAVWVVQYALGARGATARDVAWSDLSVKTFDGMYPAAAGDARMLCTYISATKTSEGVVRCIGALPHVNLWLSPVGAIADALVKMCHAEGGDPTTCPLNFVPGFRPTDEELAAAGVEPRHIREAGDGVGFWEWLRGLVFPAPQGGRMKAMSYRYHKDSLRKTLTAPGLPDWSAKTHLGRRAAAQAGKERGVSESDNKKHCLLVGWCGRWGLRRGHSQP